MERYLLIIFGVLFLSGCAGKQVPQSDKPEGKFVWENPELYEKLYSGIISSKELDHKFIMSKNLCKIQSLQIAVPSPSCTQAPRQSCDGLTGFSAGFCSSYSPPPTCNYSSVDAAKDAQKEIFNSCMSIDGWVSVWQTPAQ